MTVSWHRRCGFGSEVLMTCSLRNEESFSLTTPGGKFDDDRLADRWDRRRAGRSFGDRLRDPDQGIRFRQHLDPGRRGCGLHRDDPAWPVAGRARVENHFAAVASGGPARANGIAFGRWGAGDLER